MENVENNYRNDNIIAVIDGVVYEKKKKGRPRNEARWTEDGKHLTGYLEREKRLEYQKRYAKLKQCELCLREVQILHFKDHQRTKQCQLLKESYENKKELEQLKNK